MKRVVLALALAAVLLPSCRKQEPQKARSSYPRPGEIVDMGLSVKWRGWNVGARCPEEFGEYYAWGETSSKDMYTWATYKHCRGDAKSFTKYNTLAARGVVDGKTTLEYEDDVAQCRLIGKWRIPTDAEWTELRDKENCEWTWTEGDGVNGYTVTSLRNGASIFLPAAGFRQQADTTGVGFGGQYWSSTLCAASPYSAGYLYFISTNVRRYDNNRYFGRSIRPVMDY